MCHAAQSRSACLPSTLPPLHPHKNLRLRVVPLRKKMRPLSPQARLPRPAFRLLRKRLRSRLGPLPSPQPRPRLRRLSHRCVLSCQCEAVPIVLRNNNNTRRGYRCRLQRGTSPLRQKERLAVCGHACGGAGARGLHLLALTTCIAHTQALLIGLQPFKRQLRSPSETPMPRDTCSCHHFAVCGSRTTLHLVTGRPAHTIRQEGRAWQRREGSAVVNAIWHLSKPSFLAWDVCRLCGSREGSEREEHAGEGRDSVWRACVGFSVDACSADARPQV